MPKSVGFILSLLLLIAPLARAEGWSIRAGAGAAKSSDTTVRDRDCSAAQPPALFGYGDGIDGRPFGARGDFGSSPLFELAAGRHAGERMRIELALSYRPKLDLEAKANFTGVTGAQPVHSEGSSLAALAIGAIDLGPSSWRVRPFVTGGAGLARNESGAIVYAFPGIAPEAVTIVRGGGKPGFAWTAGGGAAIALSDTLSLELAVRYSDLGELRTDDGAATIIRPTRTLTLAIAGTRAKLTSLDALLSIRYRCR